MALIVLLRGVNVGGHRTFRPSVFARQLAEYDVENVGAAGTFVVRRPGPRAALRAALAERLPFETEMVLCDGRDILRLAADNPFKGRPARPDVVRFVSFLAAGRVRLSLPMTLPPEGEWSLRVLGAAGRLVFGEYRRNMKAIAQLGKLDKLFGTAVTTRNWNTVKQVVRVLQGDGPQPPRRGGRSGAPRAAN